MTAAFALECRHRGTLTLSANTDIRVPGRTSTPSAVANNSEGKTHSQQRMLTPRASGEIAMLSVVDRINTLVRPTLPLLLSAVVLSSCGHDDPRMPPVAPSVS